MTTVLVEKAMLETFIGEKSIVDKSVHIFQTLGKVVRTVQHAWKSSPHFFSTRENVFPFSAYIDSKGLYGIGNLSPPTTPRRNFRSGKLTSEKWSRQISECWKPLENRPLPHPWALTCSYLSKVAVRPRSQYATRPRSDLGLIHILPSEIIFRVLESTFQVL